MRKYFNILYHYFKINFSRLSWLPVWEDTDEAPYVYGYLCHLIETNNSIILGPNSSNIPRLIALIAEAFYRNAIPVDHPVAQRMTNIVRQIQVNKSKLYEGILILII